jgi:hypothetical protein
LGRDPDSAAAQGRPMEMWDGAHQFGPIDGPSGSPQTTHPTRLDVTCLSPPQCGPCWCWPKSVKSLRSRPSLFFPPTTTEQHAVVAKLRGEASPTPDAYIGRVSLWERIIEFGCPNNLGNPAV